MRADDGGVDHLHRVWKGLTVRQRLKQQVPQAGPRPSEKLPIDRAPFAEVIGQIAPRRAGAGNPENPVENTSVIARRSPPLWSCLDQKRFEESPFRMGNPASNQSCLLSRGSLESTADSAVNYFVNRA
jgi:hypothetical protein